MSGEREGTRFPKQLDNIRWETHQNYRTRGLLRLQRGLFQTVLVRMQQVSHPASVLYIKGVNPSDLPNTIARFCKDAIIKQDSENRVEPQCTTKSEYHCTRSHQFEVLGDEKSIVGILSEDKRTCRKESLDERSQDIVDYKTSQGEVSVVVADQTGNCLLVGDSTAQRTRVVHYLLDSGRPVKVYSMEGDVLSCVRLGSLCFFAGTKSEDFLMIDTQAKREQDSGQVDSHDSDVATLLFHDKHRIHRIIDALQERNQALETENESLKRTLLKQVQESFELVESKDKFIRELEKVNQEMRRKLGTYDWANPETPPENREDGELRSGLSRNLSGAWLSREDHSRLSDESIGGGGEGGQDRFHIQKKVEGFRTMIGRMWDENSKLKLRVMELETANRKLRNKVAKIKKDFFRVTAISADIRKGLEGGCKSW